MILKSYLIEKNILDLMKYQAILMYGENNGIKDDIKEELKKGKEDTETIILFNDEIIKNNELLLNNANSASLFSSKKIIFIHEANDKIFKIVEDFLQYKNSDIKLFIFSNSLEKRSKLRNYFEKNKDVGIIACYQDNERTLMNYISSRLKGWTGLSGEVINLIISNSNLDRKIIKSEIIKIKIFFKEKKINLQQLQDLLNIKQNKDFDQIRDASLLGNKAKVNALLSEIQFDQEDFMFCLNNLTYRLSKLIEIQDIAKESRNYENALDALKTKVFWKDKPIYIEQLKKWSKNKLINAINMIGNTEIIMKKNSQIKNDTLLKNLFINICLEAS
tara:strand:- start:4658 stop:5653 length:996 start_codon:yes stop_codon:yes gene_type:complete